VRVISIGTESLCVTDFLYSRNTIMKTPAVNRMSML
jgi:hypothetical protein